MLTSRCSPCRPRITAGAALSTVSADLEVVIGPRERQAASAWPRADVPEAGAATSHNLSGERTEYLIRDWLSVMCFLELGLGHTVPDAINASIAAVPKQPNTDGEEARHQGGPGPAGMGGKAGQAVPEQPRRELGTIRNFRRGRAGTGLSKR